MKRFASLLLVVLASGCESEKAIDWRLRLAIEPAKLTVYRGPLIRTDVLPIDVPAPTPVCTGRICR